VVVAGQLKLHDGSKVNAQPAPAPKASAAAAPSAN